ncbi:MAG: DUF4349 domain-containing protein, partial [Parvularculaceae bacterium]|nr:DUF4349 domain-containing protein [Parvularculaceae bacterium]
GRGEESSIVVTGARAAPVAAADAAAYSASPPPPPSEPGRPNAAGAEAGVMLAYSYSMGIKAPIDAIAPLIETHTRICLEAGPKLCQVLGSSTNKYSDDQVNGYLNLRAEPAWLKTFRANIPGDASKAGGEITQNTVSTEDLTTQITDTQARLDAKIALRDRIKALLERRDGTLADALAAERELANVQGEIDSMKAQLEIMRARVAMSALSINYETDLNKSGVAANPVVDALSDFGRVTLESLAGVIRFLSATWLPALFFLAFLFVLRLLVPLFWRRRSKAK